MKRFGLMLCFLSVAARGMGGWFSSPQPQAPAKASMIDALPVWVDERHVGYQKYFKTDYANATTIAQFRLYGLDAEPLASITFVMSKDGGPSRGEHTDLYPAVGNPQVLVVCHWSECLVNMYNNGKLLVFDTCRQSRFTIKREGGI